jgi:hypothetical protein
MKFANLLPSCWVFHLGSKANPTFLAISRKAALVLSHTASPFFDNNLIVGHDFDGEITENG